MYASSLYDGSTENLDDTSLESDNVFSDGWDMQLATVTGDADARYRVHINVPIDTSTAEEAPAATPGGEGGPGDGGEPPADGGGPMGEPSDEG